MTPTATVRPLGSRLLVRRLPAETLSDGGIIFIPDNAQERSQKAEVITLGSGGYDPDGKPFAFTVMPGDIVLVGKYNGTPVGGDEDLIIIYERDVIGIFSEDPGVTRARALSRSFRDELTEMAAACTLPQKPLLNLSLVWVFILVKFNQVELEAFTGRKDVAVGDVFVRGVSASLGHLFGFDLAPASRHAPETGFELVAAN